MKFYAPILAVFLFVSCSGNSPSRQTNKASAQIANTEKNKQIALKNEVIEVIQAAQKLEQQGRNLEALRQAIDAESARQCRVAMENRQQKVKELEVKTNNFPGDYKSYLAPIIADLNVCVSCSKKALASCIKTRAELNKAIGEMFPK